MPSEPSFCTTCPRCGADGHLMVVRCSVSTRIPLGADGFAFVDAKFVDTSDEIVRCERCGTEFPLAEVTR